MLGLQRYEMKIPTDQAYLKRTSSGLKAKYKQHTSGIENVQNLREFHNISFIFVDIHCGLVFGIVRVGKAKDSTTTILRFQV